MLEKKNSRNPGKFLNLRLVCKISKVVVFGGELEDPNTIWDFLQEEKMGKTERRKEVRRLYNLKPGFSLESIFSVSKSS